MQYREKQHVNSRLQKGRLSFVSPNEENSGSGEYKYYEGSLSLTLWTEDKAGYMLANYRGKSPQAESDTSVNCSAYLRGILEN